MNQLGQIALIPGTEIDVREPDRDCWATPWSLIEDIKKRFGPIELDVCCLDATAKAPRYFTPAEDGLAQPWDGHWFCNPPYSNIGPWVSKGLAELDGNIKSLTGRFLVPSGRTGLPWYGQLREREAAGAAAIVEMRGPGRVYFVAPPGAEPSQNMEDSLVVLAWKPFQRMGAYR